MFFESVMPSNHLVLCRSFLLMPSIFPSIRVFSDELALCIRWPKYWSLSFSINPSNEYLGLFFFRINWFDLAVQETLKRLLQHNSKTLILWHSAFFMVQLSHPYMTTRKTIALKIWTFVGKVMSLLSNMLSRFFRVFLPESKPFFNFMASVTVYSDFGAQESKICHCFLFYPFYVPWSWKVVAEPRKTPGFLASKGEDFNLGPETRLDRSEILCNEVY